MSQSDSEAAGEPVVRRANEVEYEDVGAASGVTKGVLIGEEHGAPHLALRRFTIAPGGEIPKHTNEIEHEQYVLAGEYIVGIDGVEYTVRAGDSIHIPARAVHWYRNDGDEEVAFVCAVPHGDDEISLLDG